jgi:hypothetical protein
MVQSRLTGPALLAAILFAAHLQAVRSEEPRSNKPAGFNPFTAAAGVRAPQAGKTAAAGVPTCVVYSLAGLGDDANFGRWIADTVPEVIEPGTWSQTGDASGRYKLSYFAPSRVLVVYHTAAAHAQVEAFLRDLKKALPPESARTSAAPGKLLPRVPKLIQASFAEPGPVRLQEPVRLPESAVTKSTAYPVPAPLSQPKHLFHLILRYEGDSLAESMSGLVKGLSVNETKESADKESPAKENAGSSAGDPAKAGPPLNSLLHFIVRYEGDGIIDANVASVIKYLANDGAAPPFMGGPMPPAPPPPKTPATGAVYGSPSLSGALSAPPASVELLTEPRRCPQPPPSADGPPAPSAIPASPPPADALRSSRKKS